MKIAKNKLIAIIAAVVAVAVAVIGGVAVYAMTRKEPAKPVAKQPVKVQQDDSHSGQMRSYLTGEWVPAEQGEKRAVSVMTENTTVSLPQYGINRAGVIYECPMEGGLTRMMAIYEDYTGLERIGNVRSCRPYFAYFAAEFDSIYVHYGQSWAGQDVLDTGIVNNISGLDGSVNKSFFRTDDRKAPHNAYTSEQGINDGIETKSYARTYNEYDSSYKGHYLFAEDGKSNELSDGSACEVIKPYFFNNKPSFVYNADSKTYSRYQFGDAQVDATDNTPVEDITNIIFQNVASDVYEGPEGYLKLTVDGSGEGKFFTHGKMIDTTWKKEADGITHYYDKTGNEIQLNPGRTWVCIIEDNHTDGNQFFESVAAYESENK